MLKKTNPRVILLDVGLQDRNSLRLAETVKKEMAEARVIVMDLLPAHEEIAEFVNAGVAGFILKDATFEDFVGTNSGRLPTEPESCKVTARWSRKSRVAANEAGSSSRRCAHDAAGARGDRADRGRDEQQGNREAPQHRH